MTAEFAASYAGLCLAQGAVVAVPRREAIRLPIALRGHWWALVPGAAIVATVAAIRASGRSADALTWLALVATPLLAAAALRYVIPGGGRRRAVPVVALFAVTWLFRGSLLGDLAGVALIGLGCVTLAALLAAVVETHWLELGLLVMAAIDTALVVAQLLQAPNNVLNAAAPALGLPQLQRATLGAAVMGYGDFFVAALLGAVLAKRERVLQRKAALFTTVFGWCFGLLFLAVNTLPATVPVAAAMIACTRRLPSPRSAAVSGH